MIQTKMPPFRNTFSSRHSSSKKSSQIAPSSDLQTSTACSQLLLPHGIILEPLKTTVPGSHARDNDQVGLGKLGTRVLQSPQLALMGS